MLDLYVIVSKKKLENVYFVLLPSESCLEAVVKIGCKIT